MPKIHGNLKESPILEFAVSSQQGMRPYQEDEVAIQSFKTSVESNTYEEEKNPTDLNVETYLFGIFDGHAGGKCSKYVSSNLPDILGSDMSFTANLTVALRRSFATVNEQFLQIAERQKLNDGSTGLCVVIRHDKLTVANVGDCRAVLLSDNCQRVTQLTIDQKPNTPKEKNRIASLGGYVQNCFGVFRVNGVLAVARAFGNRALRQVIRPDPEITHRRLEKDDDFIVIASDGLWDVLSNRDVLQICKALGGQSQQRIANELTSSAIKRGSMDNVTAIVVNLRQYVSSISRSNSLSSTLSPDSEEKTKHDFDIAAVSQLSPQKLNTTKSPLSPSITMANALNSNLAITTNFSNQSGSKKFDISYRQALNNRSTGDSSNSNNEKFIKEANNAMVKRSGLNISSFDEFYNKQIAASKLERFRNGSNTLHDLNNYTSNSPKYDPPYGSRSISVDRTIMRRPHTSSSISNSINKLHLIDVSTSSNRSPGPPKLGLSDYFPSSTGASITRPSSQGRISSAVSNYRS